MSTLETNLVQPATGTTLTLGASGDTVDVPSGATLDVTGATVSGLSAGKILQIQSNQGISDFSSSSTSFVDVTGATVSITPAATGSKILLMLNTNLYQNTTTAYVAMRWERDIGGSSTTFGNGTYGQSFARSAVAHDFWAGVGMTYLDSPSTTSAITYTLQASTTGSGTMGIGVNSTNVTNIFAIEVGT
jgi:hypothetical protein